MKKMFKFFMCAAIVAAGFTACSSEEVTPIGPNNPNVIDEVEGEETYATFKLGSGINSRAYTLVGSANETDDNKLTTQGGITLLLYKSASGILEKKVNMTTVSETFLVTAGKKKIFVVANYKNLPAATTIDGFIEGTSTIDELMALNFDASEANKSSFGFAPLHTIVTGGGLPASNDNSIEYDLKPDIDSNTASGGTLESSGNSPTNTFEIQLYFMLAKANLYLGPNVLNAGSATEPGISDIKYTIHNFARYTNIIRKGTGKAVQSYYFNQVYPVTPPATEPQQDAFDADFDYTAVIDKVAAVAVPTTFFYVPENNHYYLLRGQSSHFAIQAIFKPNAVVHSVKYNTGSGSLEMSTDQLVNLSPYGTERPLDYVYTLKEINGIPTGTYFKHIKLLQIAAWINVNKAEWTNSAEQQTQAEALVPASATGVDFYQFENAISYYRLDIGEDPTGNSLEPGVLRGNKYQVMINSIGGPGVPQEINIIDEPWIPVVANTNISATIKAAEWTLIVQQGNLN